MTDKQQLKSIKEDLELALLVSYNSKSSKFHLDNAEKGLSNYDKMQRDKIKDNKNKE